MPISFSVSVLWPIGQPLGSVESLPFQGGGKFQLFFGIDQAPWIGRNNLPDEILDDDPLGILPRHGPSKLYDV
ncbi:hypothetical protein DIPPA_03530 [Diplonema papillatum]|nr:hypothetical protein DIPPA_03530 [Diplonema papillatum]